MTTEDQTILLCLIQSLGEHQILIVMKLSHQKFMTKWTNPNTFILDFKSAPFYFQFLLGYCYIPL